MSKVTQEEVENISYLARLELTNEDIKKYQSELSNILGYIEMINKADVSSVEPMDNITGLVDVCRDDIKSSSNLSREEILSNTPENRDGYIKVKPVL
ncbi:Asp-tRNA(Asn)/Glu-tRNA(Gln) amidotransferase subunit GatC [Patescibacteria group bacterium]|nr:Asp-tRNA(Asn)/Glu-tRNA(Gln) amidotransferase subunit GatC [Patescibacteria group bacterium]